MRRRRRRKKKKKKKKKEYEGGEPMISVKAKGEEDKTTENNRK